jgi:glycosyltransferase involved in cell wall biosynthesis
LLDEKTKGEYELVFAGPLKERSKEVVDYAEQSKDAEKIRFLGFVEESELADLYGKASLFVFPSFYEGFGIPLLEAMSSGIPSAASNRSSLPEIGGDAVLYFDPESAKDIKDCIERLLSNEELREKLKEKGLKRVKMFNWKDHSLGIVKIFEELNE